MVQTDHKLSASLEDYLESIYHLVNKQDVARSKDIADVMQVSRASVTGALKALSEKELVYYKPYAYTTLTKKGQEVADRIACRHEILAHFFENILGVESSMAETAACRTEHTLGLEITSRLMAFIEFLSITQNNGKDITQQFQQYWQMSNGARNGTA